VALTFAQAVKIEAASGTSFGGSITPSAGSLLICGAFCGYSTTSGNPTVTDNNGGTWTSDTSGNGTFSGSGQRWGESISSSPNHASGATTVTIATNGSGGAGGTAACAEFTGAATTSPNDATSPAVKTTATSNTTVTSNSLTNTTANAVFASCFGSDLPSGTSTVTGTSTGWSFPISETNASTNYVFGFGYKIVAVAAAESSAWTITSAKWACAISVYKQAAGGGAAAADYLSLLGVG
jgi:hypothetical protein